MTTDTAITEFEDIDPDELHLVGNGANGFKALLAKSASEEVREVLEIIADATDTEIVKADDDSGDKPDPCPLCDGQKTIKDGHVKCPKCKGTGVAPAVGDTTKTLAEKAESGVAASGAAVPVDDTCEACKGSGKDETGVCDACAGTGKNADAPAAGQLNAVNADAGSVTEGAGGREAVDKAAQSTADQNVSDASKAAGYVPEPYHADADETVECPKCQKMNDVDASFCDQCGFELKGAPSVKVEAAKASGDVFTAPNLALAAAASQVVGDPAPDTGGSDSMDDGSGPMSPPATPGSPAWEAVDAQTATDAALALMTAVELMRTFAQRESTEVAMGEGNDVFDAYAASEAICAAQAALGVMAQLAFHEGLEAAKSLPDDESVEKAGRRLAGKTVAALAAARDKAKDLADHIGGVLGDDDPKKNASKSADEIDMDALSKELENMSTDELTKVLDARDEKLVGLLAEALKSAPKGDTKKSKKDKTEDAPAEAVKAEGEDAEVVAEVEADGETVAEPADDATKAALTPEEIEANEAAASAKKEAKRLKKAAEQTAADAATAKAIEEAVAKATAAVDSLKDELAAAKQATDDRLATVEKMAAPSNIVRTAPTDAQNVAKARDEKELRIATLEREARETSDPAVRAGNREIIKELRADMTAPKN